MTVDTKAEEATIVAFPESDSLDSVYASQRQAFDNERYPEFSSRVDRLDRLAGILKHNKKRIVEAVDADFGGRSDHETRIVEILSSLQGIHYTKSHLRQWMRSRRRGTSKWFLPGNNRIMPQPVGVVGVMAPWNYPVNLAVVPAASALAAGNRVMLRLSEHTPATTSLMTDLITEKFDRNELFVCGGDADLAARFSRQPFDHLMFTGSTAVGRHVLRAAAENMTPVTLELGGKSPVIVGRDFTIGEAAERIAWGKTFNAGQTCVAPDYAFVPAEKLQLFIASFVSYFEARYKTVESADYTAVVNQRFHSRLAHLVTDAREKGAEIYEVGASRNLPEGSRKMPLTIVVNAPEDALISQEEIFGPVLLIKTYEEIDSALDVINAGDRPLALYIFSHDTPTVNHIMRQTHAGGVTVNDVMLQFLQEGMPFGGVGASGMGTYHGPEGFETFSHMKPVFRQQGFGSFTGLKTLYPPYGRLTDFMIRIMGG